MITLNGFSIISLRDQNKISKSFIMVYWSNRILVKAPKIIFQESVKMGCIYKFIAEEWLVMLGLAYKV